MHAYYAEICRKKILDTNELAGSSFPHLLDRGFFRLVLFHAHQFTQHARIFWSIREFMRLWGLFLLFIFRVVGVITLITWTFFFKHTQA